MCHNLTKGRTAVIAVKRGFPEINSVRQYCHIDIFDVTEATVLFEQNASVTDQKCCVAICL
ncbi:MAG: hypothetical protein CFE36_11830 [Sphingomonadaceae bacterium PASS1]|nr:MAG: hypothetical protein CFE36_11830 [Sphingomonadaceae bacterium PASS1]